ncbi:SDR family oxidoreductase [Vacuolonema iberomarrocanum]|uniref:SDR family oxidoreductase n=1 Tax=Vacuolonema iberomarrocanum TaxID=3454632 RepID=UPI0019FA8993|nr:SDR family oxidoreductase [filamentous cyanobacterium LEGE 07170]
MSYSQSRFRPGVLAEQVVLITGASAGIGDALARQLAQRFPGIRLVLTARRQERLEAIAEACEKAGADVLTIPADLTDATQVVALTEKALAHFGRVDVLVNNAGYGQMGSLELIPQSAVERQFAVNVFAPVALSRALIPAMREQGGGHILNLSSIAGVVAFPLGGAYSASKFALEALSDSLRMELEPFNIAVTVIEPGPVATEFADVAKAQIADLPDPLGTPYQPAFETFATLEDQLEKQMWTSDRVATVVIKALTAKNPRPRYTAATGGDVLVFLMTKLLPTRWVDRFWQRFYGIDKMMNGNKP